MNAKNIFVAYIKCLLIILLIYNCQNICSQDDAHRMYYDEDKSIKIDEAYTQSTEIFPFKEKSIFSLGTHYCGALKLDNSKLPWKGKHKRYRTETRYVYPFAAH